MGMITRVRGRLHSITKLDPQIKDEKIAETVCLLSVLFLLPYCGARGSHAPLLLKLGSVWLATYSCLVLPLLVSANYKYPARWLRAAIMYLPGAMERASGPVLNFLWRVYSPLDRCERVFMKMSNLSNMANQLIFFIMCDKVLLCAFSGPDCPHKKATDLTFIFFYNLCSILNYLLPIYLIVDSWENAYLEHSALQTIINQLLFFTMCDILFCTHEKGKPIGLTGLNSLLFYYIITFFVKRVADIFKTYNTTPVNNQTKNKSVMICILKIILEWAKAVIIIICLREQGLEPHPNILYTVVTFLYYVCTENVFIDIFPKFLTYLNLDRLEGLEPLYAPVILNCCSLTISSFLSTFLYLQSFNRLATFIFYHSIILNYKGAKSRCWQKLKEEKNILKMFRQATKKEIEDWNDICAICLQPMMRARVTKCSHLFHAECLRRCCKVSHQCPLCKADLRDISRPIVVSS